MTQTQPKGDPLPTPEQFRRCHESLWMRPADLAAWEAQQKQGVA